MPGIIAHLTIANKILQECPELVCDVSAFYLGSVAPDTIESKIGCTRNDKKRVHLREEIKDVEWLNNEKMFLFKNRILFRHQLTPSRTIAFYKPIYLSE